MDEARVPKFVQAMEQAGLFYTLDEVPGSMTGLEFHARFNGVLTSWLSEAFAHPFWERMMSGKGSARLFTGWLIALYHYTKTATRHSGMLHATMRSHNSASTSCDCSPDKAPPASQSRTRRISVTAFDF